MDAPEIEDEVLATMSSICLALPETTLRSDRWAHAYEIRRRIFAILASPNDTDGNPVPIVSCRADPAEREALLAIGHPYFPAGGGADRIGVVVGPETDWSEIRELVTESYRILAPKKLVALLDP